MSDEMADRFSEGLLKRISDFDTGALTDVVDESSIFNLKKNIYLKIHMAVLSTDISALLEEEVKKILRSDFTNGILASLLLNDDMIVKIAGYAGERLTDYMMNHDLELIWPVLNELEKAAMGLSAEDAGELIGIDRDMLKGLVKAGYLKFMSNAKSAIAEGFHMKQFIYDKIMELDPGEIEHHVNNSIKREMNYLVYLGGFLGLLIGIVNIFI